MYALAKANPDLSAAGQRRRPWRTRLQSAAGDCV